MKKLCGFISSEIDSCVHIKTIFLIFWQNSTYSHKLNIKILQFWFEAHSIRKKNIYVGIWLCVLSTDKIIRIVKQYLGYLMTQL